MARQILRFDPFQIGLLDVGTGRCAGAVRVGAGVRARRRDAPRPGGDGLMPVIVRLDDLLHDRRLTLSELADRVGITLANLSILKTGKARAIRFSTLEAICRELDCKPGDLDRTSTRLNS